LPQLLERQINHLVNNAFTLFYDLPFSHKYFLEERQTQLTTTTTTTTTTS